MSTSDRDDRDEDELFPPPERLAEVLASNGFDPDDLAQMVDMASLGIAARWWRNTVVEEWHAGKTGVLSDMDMYRINTHTTAKVRERLRAWCRRQGIHTMGDVADADPDPTEAVVRNLYRWFINPRRVLITGHTLYGVVEQTLANVRADPECDVPDDVTPETDLAEYDETVARAAGYLLTCMDKHDPRSMLHTPAIFGIAWGPNWWLRPGYHKHVDAVFAATSNPTYRRAGKYPIPPPPPGTDLARVRRLMLTKPWELPEAVCEWLIYDVGEHYINDNPHRPR